MTPRTSINTAIGDASAGWTVWIEAGTFTEDVIVNKSVTIRGAGQGQTIIRPATSFENACGGSLCPGSSTSVILIQASNVTIHDLTVDGMNDAVDGAGNIDARNGIIENHVLATPYNNNEIYNVTVQNIFLRGIQMGSGGTGFNVHDNTVLNVESDAGGNSIGIAVFSGSGTVANNYVDPGINGSGINMNRSSGTLITGNTITNAALGINSGNYGEITPGATSVDTITGNTVTNSTWGILGYAGYDTINITDNTVLNADEVGIAIIGQNNAAQQATISGNTIDGQGDPDTIGIYIEASYTDVGITYPTDVNATISDNIVINNAYGIAIDGSATTDANVPIDGNQIENNNVGIQIDNTTVTGGGAHGNSIMNNGFGIQNNTTVVFDATDNWWGDVTGPNHATNPAGTGNAVSDFVLFDPYLTVDPFPAPPTPPVTPTPTITIDDTAFVNNDPYRCNRWHDIAVFRERNSLDLYLVNPLSKGEFYTRFSYTDLLAFELAFSSGQITNPLFTSRTSEYHPGANLNAIYLGNGNWQFIVFRPGRIAVSDVCFRLGPIRP